MKIFDLFKVDKVKSKAQEIIDSLSDVIKYSPEEKEIHLNTIKENGQYRIVTDGDLYSFQQLNSFDDSWINSTCSPYKTIDEVIDLLLYFINSDKKRDELDKKEWESV